MTGKVIIVTGASSGLGYETARYLCEGGNDVILACRDEEKTQRAIAKIKQQNPNALATYLHLDLASLKSVRQFVEEFHALDKKLNVLINNAGLALNFKDTKRQYTEENFELTIGTNHLGPFLLTNLLLEDLKKTASSEGGDARVIVVTSSMHEPKSSKRTKNLQPLDMDNFLLFNDNTYNGLQAYKNSKAANLLFTYELAKKLDGTGVKVNAICPGIVPTTALMRHAGGAQKAFARYVLHGMLRFAKLTRTIPQSATAISALATDDKFKDVTGKYIKDGAETKSSDETLNEELQTKLWELSGRYTGLEGYELLEVTRPQPPPPTEQEKKPGEGEEEEVAKKDEENREATEGDANKMADNHGAEEIKNDGKEQEHKNEEQEEKKDAEKVEAEDTPKIISDSAPVAVAVAE